MKIFFLGYSLNKNSGGIENYTFTILKFLEEKGHKIITFTKSEKIESFTNINIKRIKYVDRYLLGIRIAKKLYKQHKDIDIFLCGHLNLTNLMETIVKFYATTYHLFVYGIDCWAGRFKVRLPHLKKLDKVISISSFTSKQIKKQGFTGDVIYVPCIVDVKNFSEILSPKVDNDIVKFITVSRLSSAEKSKGHDKVIEAVKFLVQEKNITNLEYRIVGKGDDRSRLEQKVKDLNLESFVKFYGFVPDKKLSKLYFDSDVFIMPSNVTLNPQKPEGEGFGIVFLEAGLCNLPLIGPNDGGSTDLIKHEVNGLECEPLNVKDIANNMKILIYDKSLRIRYGKNAKKMILENFTLSQLDKYLSPIFDK